jgi:uncharacterized protein YkwD
MILKHATMILAAVVLAAAAALGFSTIGPRMAEAADTVTVTGCTGTEVILDVNEKTMLDLHNKQRATKQLKALCVHPDLQKAAEAHSQDMIDKDYFAHDSQNGTTFAQRIEREGYNYRTAGENIAWGSGPLGSPDNTFKNWMNSTGHKRNIMNAGFREVGIGAATGTYKTYSNATMWTADFGAR